jgi:hypothetical protein
MAGCAVRPREQGIARDDATHRHAGPRAQGARYGDFIAILSGTLQNVAGIAVAAAAMFVVQLLMTRALGADSFGVVALLAQCFFVASFATTGAGWT